MFESGDLDGQVTDLGKAVVGGGATYPVNCSSPVFRLSNYGNGGVPLGRRGDGR